PSAALAVDSLGCRLPRLPIAPVAGCSPYRLPGSRLPCRRHPWPPPALATDSLSSRSSTSESSTRPLSLDAQHARRRGYCLHIPASAAWLLRIRSISASPLGTEPPSLKIGRASCRERVESWGVVVALR